jgi:hypothetical protein
MIRYKKKIKTKQLFEMANISTNRTGLDIMIWVSYKTGKEKHGPRIKIKIDNEFIPISIEDDPKIMLSKFKINKLSVDSRTWKDIVNWIRLNKDILLDYWNAGGNQGIEVLIKNLKRLKRFHE